MPDFGLAEPGRSPGPVAILLYLLRGRRRASTPAPTAAGATSINDVSDQFHGDRAGSLRDPFGHRWAIATHTEDMSEAELHKRFDEIDGRRESESLHSTTPAPACTRPAAPDRHGPKQPTI